jgi:L-alanine-DL-glutamate epimerase-like enolase superfamily enzyme
MADFDIRPLCTLDDFRAKGKNAHLNLLKLGAVCISASSRYYVEDIAEPAFTLNPDSTLSVPTAPGLGVMVNLKTLEKYTLQKSVLSVESVS